MVVVLLVDLQPLFRLYTTAHRGDQLAKGWLAVRGLKVDLSFHTVNINNRGMLENTVGISSRCSAVVHNNTQSGPAGLRVARSTHKSKLTLTDRS